ncbi:C45 family autoproteolytic acyltransferase/hydolase [Bacteroides acidifaciens]|uniref:C45 family autoproteolytic acyltransferase/hydolase n=1 Tax=Bacteroides acidifaciens TaxID=85831 RepID=UPI002432E21C|nr:C45 family autoproteolytic acyltransferase/hydolase [Bacteroides acidifaciens]
MHKVIKQTIKYTSGILLLLVIVLIGGISYLYFSADMMTPPKEPDIIMVKVPYADTTALVPAEVLYKDTLDLRYYADNFMRHSESGLWELFVRGDALERGDAIGKLSADLLHHQEKVFVDQIREIIPSDSYLKFLRFFIVLFNRNLGENVPEEYREEIYGISLSCTHDYDFIGTPYERQLNYHAAHDLGHAMQDYMLVGCSSFATWGTQSADSSLLIGRNFDFYVGDAFAENKQVTFCAPSKGYKFASIGWPGMIGILSGMNEAGLTVTINAAKSAMPTSSATPISILTREILQYASTIDEAFAIAQKRKTFVSESILIGSAKDGRAAIIEKSPEKTVLFNGKEKDRIICTNHYQSDAFAKDERNMENIRTSDSPYRYARLEELISENQPMNPVKAASILRNHKGRQNADLGLANEMAINQFIAHHSVIFQPEKQLMWVSTSPWQCGKYVAYDLNLIFKKAIALRAEIYIPELTIPADEFMQEPEFEQLLTYKRLTPLLLKKIKAKEKVEDSLLKEYEASNPSFYYVYEVLGNYYEAIRQPQQAVGYWKKALTRPIPKLQEKERIQQKIQKHS